MMMMMMMMISHGPYLSALEMQHYKSLYKFMLLYFTYREHVVTFGVGLLAFLLLDVELAEEVERKHRVQVDDDARQHERQDQLHHHHHHHHYHHHHQQQHYQEFTQHIFSNQIGQLL